MVRVDKEPAWGERNAVTGYYPQYRVSAALVISGLRQGSLSWVALADPNAGRVDDFQIATDQRVDGYQFKWSRFGGTFTFSELTKPSDSAPGLIEQLADGWKRLRASHPHHRAVVHLVTNQHPSTSDQPPAGDPPPEQRHFAAFLEQVWKPAHTSTAAAFIVPTIWQTTWDALRLSSKLSAEEFEDFVRNCELEFGCSLPATEGMSRRDAELYEEDLSHVTEKLFAAVYDPQHIVRLNRDELLNRLGWRSQFRYRNQHSFPVDEVLYQPIEESRESLEHALNEFDGGYIGILGTPGSGKSTLLTQTLRYFPQRVIRYYAFIPDAQDAAVRGESVNFLHDVVRAIEDAGFKPGRGINHPDRDQLRERLREQLILLHDDWRVSGRKTIILVDGLDHIPREQHPTHSLLGDLPLPEQIPQGIYFVLGSQTDQLDGLPSAVQLAIRQPERRIEMRPLGRDAVRRIAMKAPRGSEGHAIPISPAQTERIFQLSAGHPLALIYLLRQLESAANADGVDGLLQHVAPYDGRIEVQYQGYWRQLDDDDELAELLGQIARLRGVIDLRWVESWSSAAVVRRLRRKFAHLFKIEDHDRWYFFHNSFRRFLGERTSHSSPGVFDPTRDRTLHRVLAEKCRQSADAQWQWEEIYHLYRAEADEDLLQRARPEVFREQFLNFRPVEAIRTDIVLAIKAAGRRRDVISLVRLLLCDAEMAQREANTESLELIPLLLSLGEEHAAIGRLRDGQRLRVAQESALSNATELLNHGLEREARQLFDLGEPLEHLSGAKELDRHDRSKEHGLLEAWASAATHFRSPDEVIAAIQRVKIEPERITRVAEAGENQAIEVVEAETDQTAAAEQADAESSSLQNLMLLRAGQELAADERWEDLEKIDSLLLNRGTDGEEFWFALRNRCWRSCQAEGDAVRARKFLDETIARLERASISDKWRVVIAEGLYRINGEEERARLWLEQAQPLKLQQTPDFNFGFSVFDHLFRYARLLYAFGERLPPGQLIADPADPRRMGSAYFQRGVCAVARLWAQGWRGGRADRASIKQEVFPLLRLFNHSWRDSKWDSWYALTEIKGEFYEVLIQAVALHGAEAVEVLAEEFVNEWTSNSRFWSSKATRHVIIALYAAGASEEWASEQLRRVEELITSDELSIRIGEKIEQVRAWLELGEADEARRLLLDALLDSSSVGNKDYQLSEWINWLRRINRLEPEGAPARIAWFAQAIIDLERNGGPSRDAAYDLLEAVFEWSPRRAVKLFGWFLVQGLVDFDDAVRRLLHSALASSAAAADIVATILIDFLLPISDADSKLVESLVLKLHKQSGVARVIKFAREFNPAVGIHSLPSDRRVWRRGLARGLAGCEVELSVAGLSDDDLKVEKNGSTSDELLLKDGSALTSDEVRARASTLPGLRELMQQDGGSYFSWGAIVDKLSSSLTDSAEILEVADYFTDRSYSARILGTLAERLLALGDMQNARLVARRLLSLSESSGWTERLSGDTKIIAFKVLTAVDGAPAREHALAEFIEDMTGAFRYPRYAVQSLDGILPLFVEEVPEREVWAQIEPFVHSLFPAAEVGGYDAELLAVLSEMTDADTPTNALADLLALHVAHPVNLLAHSAQVAFIRLLTGGEPAAVETVRRLLRGNEREQEATLMVVDAASARNSRVASLLKVELETLASAPSFAVRLVAQRVGHRAGVSLSVIIARNEAESSLYELSLPPGREVQEVWRETPLTARTEYDYLPETEDPYELLKIQLVELEMVASHARVPKENVIQRAAQIARTLVQEDDWAKLGEQRIRNRLNLAKLRYGYRRPRATIARRAFFHIAAELADAGRLGALSLAEMKPFFDYYDPEMFFVKPTARPEFIATMSGGRHERRFAASQLDREESEHLRIRTGDGLVIFGEYTKVKRLEWETPKVVRQSVISVVNPGTAIDRYTFFHRELFCSVDGYTRKSVAESPRPVVIWHEGHNFDPVDPKWLAFNPELARLLGWTPHADRLFGWADENGQRMVWSVYWKDGLFEEQPPKLEDEVGEGWAVVGVTEAIEKIELLFGTSMKQYWRIERSWREDDEKKQKVATGERSASV